MLHNREGEPVGSSLLFVSVSKELGEVWDYLFPVSSTELWLNYCI